MRNVKDQRPYYATRAELRAIDEALRERKAAPAKMVRAALARLRPKRWRLFDRRKQSRLGCG